MLLRQYQYPLSLSLSLDKTTLLYYSIAELAAKLSVGTKQFEGLANSLRINNEPLSPYDYIHTMAKLDAYVAHAYGINIQEYQTILDSFKFTENPALLQSTSIQYNDNKTLRQLYGEVRKLAPHYYTKVDKHEI